MRNHWAAVFFFLCFMFFISVAGLAQTEIGVEWDVSGDQSHAVDELQAFQELGITHLSVDTLLSDTLWSEIDSLDMEVYAEVPFYYPTISSFAAADSSTLDNYRNYLQHFASQPAVTAIGLFRFGQTQSPDFAEALEPFVQELQSTYSGNIFYIGKKTDSNPSDQLLDFKLIGITQKQILNNGIPPPEHSVGGFLYNTTEKDTLIRPVDNLLSIADNNDIPVFFESGWLLNTIEAYPELADTIQHYLTTGEIVLPLPQEPNQSDMNQHSFAVIILLLIWGIFTLNYHINPLHRKATTRYFTAHRFLVDDIMQRHLRSLTPGLLILLQHILAGGLVSYVMASALFSEYGLQAIAYHFPIATFFGDILPSIFIWGCLVTLLLHLLSLGWIGLLNKKINHISQVLLVYCWPLQINFVVVTLMVTFLTAFKFSWLFYLSSAVFGLILIANFVVSAVDTANFLKKGRGLFLLLSAGIYSAATLAFGIWMLNQQEWIEVVQLALQLS